LLPPSGNTPPGTQIFKPKSTGGFALSTLDEFGGGWVPNGTNTLGPGVGVWINAATAFTLTFVGEVPQGSLSNPTPTGFTMAGSQVPQAGLINTALGFPMGSGDQIFQYQGPGLPYKLSTVDEFDPTAWIPSQPTLAVGEAVWILRAPGSPTAWTRTFSVN